MRTTEVSVVVPVYRGEQSIPELVERTQKVFAERALDGEIVLVNDGSPDASWETIQALSARYHNVSGINLMRNYGQHCALLCGIRAASKSVVVTMDDDLEHRPEDIPLLLAKIDEGYDLIYATPQKMPHPSWRNALSRLEKHLIAFMTGVRSAADLSAHRAFRTQLRDAFADTHSPDVVIDFMFPWATTKIASVTVQHDPRKFGNTTYTLPKLISHGIGLIVGHTVAPLRLASFIGFAFTLFGLYVLCYAVWHWYLGHTLPGFPFIASLIAVMSGAQLFSLGIIGEYLARMYKQSIDRPAYVIRSRTAPAIAE